MEEFRMSDVVDMPTNSISYVKAILSSGGLMKWIPASLIAIFTDINQVFGTLFWIVGLLWLCDFLIGTAKAWVDDKDSIQWGKSFKSVIKLIVMGVGVLSIHFIEKLIKEGGIDLQGKFVGAVLLAMGTTEGISVVDNLAYFFPQMNVLFGKIREILLKVRNGNGSQG